MLRLLTQLFEAKYAIPIISVNLVITYYIFKLLAKWEPLFSKKDVDTLFSKLPGDGSQGATDYGSHKGVKVRIGRKNVVGLGNLDLVVVGGGLSGLTLSSFMAQHGYKTLCLTSGQIAGGSVSSLEMKGYEFPVGWSRYEISQAGKKMLDYVTGGGIEWGKVGDDVVFVGEERWTIPSNMEECVAYFVKNFPREEKGIREFFSLVMRTGRVLKFWHLAKCLEDKWYRERALKLFKRFFGEGWLEGQTAKGVVESMVEDSTLRALLMYRLGAGGGSVAWPRLAQEWRDNFKPHLYPVGGPMVLAYHMCEVIRLSKGLVLTEAKVKALKFDDEMDMGVSKTGKKRSGRCWGVNVKGNEVYCLRVVWAAGLRGLWETTEKKEWGKSEFASKLKHWSGEAVGTGADGSSGHPKKIEKVEEEDDDDEPVVVEVGAGGIDLDDVQGIDKEAEEEKKEERLGYDQKKKDPYGLSPAPATLIMFLGYNLAPSELPFTSSNVTVLHSDDIEGNLRRYDRKWNEAEIPWIEMYSPSVCDKRYGERWPNRTTLVIKCKTDYAIWAGYKKVGNLSANLEYIKLKEFFEKKLLKAVDKAYPGIKDQWHMKELKTPVDHDLTHEVSTGSGDGMGHSPERYGELEDFFAPSFRDVPGLFVTGKDMNGGGFEGGIWSGIVTGFSMSKKRVREFVWDYLRT